MLCPLFEWKRDLEEQTFLNNLPSLFDEILVDKRVSQSLFKITQGVLERMRDLSFLAAFFMVLMFLWSFYFEFKYVDGGNKAILDEDDFIEISSSLLLNILGLIQICTSICAILIYLKNRSLIIYLKHWRNRFKSLKPLAKSLKSIS